MCFSKAVILKFEIGFNIFFTEHMVILQSTRKSILIVSIIRQIQKVNSLFFHIMKKIKNNKRQTQRCDIETTI